VTRGQVRRSSPIECLLVRSKKFYHLMVKKNMNSKKRKVRETVKKIRFKRGS